MKLNQFSKSMTVPSSGWMVDLKPVADEARFLLYIRYYHIYNGSQQQLKQTNQVIMDLFGVCLVAFGHYLIKLVDSHE